MCDVLIINSPIFKEKVQNFNEDALPPLGLGYIATSLQKNQFKVELIDAFADNLTVTEIHMIISRKAPKFVALNVFTTNFELVKEIVETYRHTVDFIIGGPITKHIYRDLADWKSENSIDIVIGDGEQIINDIVRGKLKDHPIYVSSRRRVFKVDKDSIYFSNDISSLQLNRSFFKNEPIVHPLGFIEANLITSRGCIHDCAFCGAARSLNQEFSVRERTPDSIINELLYLSSIYPSVNSIRVLDDLFLKNLNNIKKAIKIFTSLDLNWRSMAHITTFSGATTSEIVDLKTSGCNELFMGIESGSVNILKMINKTSNVALIKETIIKLFAAGINIKGYFVFGFPEETEHDMIATYNLAYELKQYAHDLGASFRVSVFQFRPYHGTALYNKILQTQVRPKETEMNSKLSERIGRSQFNFSSGNYSQCNEETLLRYIELTNDLNNL